MRSLKVCISMAVALGMIACATAPAPTYEAAPVLGNPGYLTAPADNGRFTVVYTGAQGMSREQVTQFALLRAAEFTTESGKEWFAIIERKSQSVKLTPVSGDLSARTGGTLAGNPTSGTGSGAPTGDSPRGVSDSTTRGGPSTGGFGGGDVPYQVLERWEPPKVSQTVLIIQMGSGEEAKFPGLDKAPEIFGATKTSAEIRATMQP